MSDIIAPKIRYNQDIYLNGEHDKTRIAEDSMPCLRIGRAQSPAPRSWFVTPSTSSVISS
jgi:hypothetical protein